MLDPVDSERILLSQQWDWMAKVGPVYLQERDVSHWLGRAVPFLIHEVEVQHRLQAEFIQGEE